MRHLYMRICGAAFGIVLAAAPAPAFADQPTDQLRETINRVLAILTNPDVKEPERRKRIREAANDRFDWAAMASSAMGVYWRDRTPDEKRKFTELFTDVIESAYMDKIESYSNEKVRYLGDATDDGYGTIKTSIVTQKGTEIPVTYRVKKEKEEWLIYDVIIEGVSLVNNYRSQISTIMTNASYEGLIKKLKEKLETEKKSGKS